MAKPDLTCCVPYGAHFPSGWGWVHSRSCPDYPREKVGGERTPEQIARAAALRDHPSGVSSPVETWRSHPPNHGCWDCRYVEFWLDRDDDWEEVEA